QRAAGTRAAAAERSAACAFHAALQRCGLRRGGGRTGRRGVGPVRPSARCRRSRHGSGRPYRIVLPGRTQSRRTHRPGPDAPGDARRCTVGRRTATDPDTAAAGWRGFRRAPYRRPGKESRARGGAYTGRKQADQRDLRARARAGSRLLGRLKGRTAMTARPEIEAITARIRERSKPTREAYLARVDAAISSGPHRSVLSCGNLAHGFAAFGPVDK